jgi:hypothetical protein
MKTNQLTISTAKHLITTEFALTVLEDFISIAIMFASRLTLAAEHSIIRIKLVMIAIVDTLLTMEFAKEITPRLSRKEIVQRKYLVFVSNVLPGPTMISTTTVSWLVISAKTSILLTVTVRHATLDTLLTLPQDNAYLRTQPTATKPIPTPKYALNVSKATSLTLHHNAKRSTPSVKHLTLQQEYVKPATKDTF